MRKNKYFFNSISYLKSNKWNAESLFIKFQNIIPSINQNK